MQFDAVNIMIGLFFRLEWRMWQVVYFFFFSGSVTMEILCREESRLLEDASLTECRRLLLEVLYMLEPLRSIIHQCHQILRRFWLERGSLEEWE
jgi:hypothetical protein